MTECLILVKLGDKMDQKKKFKKKKERERKVKEKLLRRREQLKIERAEEKRRDEEYSYVTEEKLEPFRYSEEDKEKKAKAKEIEKRLKHNMKILKALEEKIIEEERAKGIDKTDEEIKAEFHAALKEAAETGKSANNPEELFAVAQDQMNKPRTTDSIEILDNVHIELAANPKSRSAIRGKSANKVLIDQEAYKKAYEARLYSDK